MYKKPGSNNKTNTGPQNIFEAIARIAYFSYERVLANFPYIKEYFADGRDSRNEWVLWITAAGAGYVLLDKEGYAGEHAELGKAIEQANMTPFVKSFLDRPSRHAPMLGIGEG